MTLARDDNLANEPTQQKNGLLRFAQLATQVYEQLSAEIENLRARVTALEKRADHAEGQS